MFLSQALPADGANEQDQKHIKLMALYVFLTRTIQRRVTFLAEGIHTVKRTGINCRGTTLVFTTNTTTRRGGRTPHTLCSFLPVPLKVQGLSYIVRAHALESRHIELPSTAPQRHSKYDQRLASEHTIRQFLSPHPLSTQIRQPE